MEIDQRTSPSCKWRQCWYSNLSSSRSAAGAVCLSGDRSALDAVQHVHKPINTGHGQIVDADLSSYFDSASHAELMARIS